eukprot:GHVL01035673.1.p1 GENE.GHVL01035673.1~~GHVL01035673.1.p1  ORF type:complete len:182 (-),score=34.31 GHVL01035673.1:520-1065(-)
MHSYYLKTMCELSTVPPGGPPGVSNMKDDISSKKQKRNDEQKSKKKKTLSVALPASIIANCQSAELRSYLVAQIARAATVYSVDELVIYEDMASEIEPSGVSKSLSFFVRNLKYLETPQYLRRRMFGIHPDLKYAGLQNPLDAPHHLRKHELKPYREGVVVENNEHGAVVDCGLDEIKHIF